ncbi:lysophospholipid acyltransferase family protein [Falsarthrobacter nasiphocae]|uniref:1-acyl-sn-glycerol-3-phosphate acyltransferase n=1 Tax=Falsarthrobacter nasiphocae TaxID=189863 RepID=A0AAE3YEB7_9MICC|nr:lysophospholipid acyltransferase family protein [Falsarthrobacter nasiphocae]MDR6891167.1 1-acyl-sn-glycerol-3-phosphate acyltransferase [Falsarthrobacter nasiphocae]
MTAYDLTHVTVRAAIKGLCRPTITGLENVPAEGPFIVASNHLSFLDSVIIQAIMPRPVSFFAKAEYFTTPGIKGRAMKAFFTAVRSIPVERGEQAEAVAALRTLLGILEKGDGVGIYPEGTRSRDGRLYRGRTGVGWLALAAGVPVVPVGLIGTERLQPAGRNWIVPRHFEMRVGEPLRFEHLGERHPLPKRRQATDEIMNAIASLSGQERVATYNERPAAAI